MAQEKIATPGAKRGRTRGMGSMTEKAILEAASPIFAQHGYEAVSLRRIAELANITAPSIYIYFKDKRSLYVAVCMHSLSRHASMIFKEMRKGQTAEERLEGFMHGMAKGLIDDPSIAKLFQWVIVEGDTEILYMIERRIFRQPLDALTALLAEITGDDQSENIGMSFFALALGTLQFAQLMEITRDDMHLRTDAQALSTHVCNMLFPRVFGPNAGAKRRAAPVADSAAAKPRRRAPSTKA